MAHRSLSDLWGLGRDARAVGPDHLGESRRAFLRRAAWAGAGLATLGLLVACGGEAPAPPLTSATASTSSSAAAPSSATSSAAKASTSSAAASTSTSAAPVGSDKAGKVLVRTPGGAYEEAWRKASWEPFAEETGIQVVPIATNAGKLLAMAQAGHMELDVLDTGAFQCEQMKRFNALEKLDTGKFKLTNLKDVEPVTDFYVVHNIFGEVLAYSTKAFPNKHPTTWAEFWDVGTFPGPRTLQDMAAGQAGLEFALLADGVAMDKLYPIDIERAFKKLQTIRKSILKWWDTGALSAQLFAENQVVLGSIWNGRIQIPIDGGAPLAIEWNQSKRDLSAIAIAKGAPNLENAYRLVDYELQPKVQAAFAKAIPYGPANAKAFEFIDEKTAARLPTSPEHKKVSFVVNVEWWVDNVKKVTDRWQEFLLAK